MEWNRKYLFLVLQFEVFISFVNYYITMALVPVICYLSYIFSNSLYFLGFHAHSLYLSSTQVITDMEKLKQEYQELLDEAHHYLMWDHCLFLKKLITLHGPTYTYFLCNSGFFPISSLRQIIQHLPEGVEWL